MKSARLLIFLLAGVLTTGLPAQGISQTAEIPVEPHLESEQEVAQYLFDDQYRPLLKKHSLELAPFIGPILGSAFPTSIVYGMRTAYHFTERFAVGIDGGFTQSGIEPFTLGTVTTQGDQNSYFMHTNVTWHFPTALGTRVNHALRTDLFITGGAGVFVFNSFDDQIEPSGNIGGGTKMFLSKYVILRIDVRNFLMVVGPPNSRKLSSNAMIMFGFSFFLPNQFEPRPAATASGFHPSDITP